MDPSNITLDQTNQDTAFQAGLQAALAEANAKSSPDVHVTSDPASIAKSDNIITSLPVRPAGEKTRSTAKGSTNSPAVLSEVDTNAAPNAQSRNSDSLGRIEGKDGEERWGGDHGGSQSELAVTDDIAPKKKKKSKSKKKKGLV